MILKEQKPLVSICSITYNHAPYIRQCLDSMLMQQTDFDYEIIINDDCSTDGTTEIIKEYESKYPHIIKPIYQDENQFSKGVRGMFAKFVFPQAQGKYIAICEGDDYWTDPLKLQKQVDFLESHPDYSMCFHSAMKKWEKGEYSNSNWCVEDRDYSGVDIYKKWTVPTASVLLRKEVIDSDIYKKAIESNQFCYGDILVFLSATSIGRVKGVSDIMSVYRKHEGGVVFHIDDKKLEAYIQQNNYIPKIFGAQYKNVSKYLICDASCILFRRFLQKAEYKKAISILLFSIKYSLSATMRYFGRLLWWSFKK